MPFFPFDFTKTSTSEQHVKLLENLKTWSASNTAKSQPNKAIVLNKISEFITNNKDVEALQIYDNIMRNIALSEMLFVHYVIKQIKKIKTSDHPLLLNFLPIVQEIEENLKVPLINMQRLIALSMGGFSFITRFNAGLLLSCLTFFTSEKIIDFFLDELLRHKLARKATGAEKSDSGLDNFINGADKLIGGGYILATNFFKNNVLSKITSAEEQSHKKNF